MATPAQKLGGLLWRAQQPQQGGALSSGFRNPFSGADNPAQAYPAPPDLSLREYMEIAAMTQVPGVADVASGGLSLSDLMRGDYGSAALNGLGALPLVPAMGGVLKVSKSTAAHRPSDAVISERMLNQGYWPHDWYHGHAGNAFDKIDPKKLGSVTQTPGSSGAMFASRSRENAEGFARNAAKESGADTTNVMRLRIAPDKGGAGQLVWPDSNPPLRSANGQRMLAQYIEAAKADGLQALIIRGADDSVQGGKPADILAIIDPKIARDADRANFDPIYKGVSGLTLGVGGLGLAGLLSRQLQQPQPD